MFKRIVIPLDGAELAERALLTALHLNLEVGSEIILLRVPVVAPMSRAESAGGLSWWYPDQALQHAANEAKAYLNAICAKYDRPDVRLVMEVVEGDPAGKIVDLAAAREADVIVMSTHGYSGISHWVMGSVAEKVVRGASCPVMVVRAARPVQRILAPVDGSDHAESSLAVALDLAQQTGATVTLLHVVEPAFVLEPGILGWEHFSIERNDLALTAAEESAARYLSHLRQRHAGHGVTMNTALHIGPVAATILKVATEESADVIVMATHGRTGLRRWAYGSVTEKVLRAASCGLLIVHIPAHLLRQQAEFAGMPEAEALSTHDRPERRSKGGKEIA